MTKTMRGHLLAAVILLIGPWLVTRSSLTAHPLCALRHAATAVRLVEVRAVQEGTRSHGRSVGSHRQDLGNDSTRAPAGVGRAVRSSKHKLSRLIQNDADEAVLARQIDRVETARANANKTRSLMLVQMVKTLTPEQRSRFKVLNERWQQDLQQRRQADPRKPRDH